MGVCKVKNIVIGEGMPKICVPVVSNNHQDIITDLIRLQSLDIDLIELRIDYFNELLDHQKLTELFKAIASMAIKQGIILTYRSVPEGGNGKLSNDEYMQLYSIALESGAFDIYDVELSSGTNTIINLSNLIHQNGTTMQTIRQARSVRHVYDRIKSYRILYSLLSYTQKADDPVRSIPVLDSVLLQDWKYPFFSHFYLLYLPFQSVRFPD